MRASCKIVSGCFWGAEIEPGTFHLGRFAPVLECQAAAPTAAAHVNQHTSDNEFAGDQHGDPSRESKLRTVLASSSKAQDGNVPRFA
jgi:hypothetical protein